MRNDLHQELTRRLKQDYGFEDKGDYLRRGKCPQCAKGQRELWTWADKPWVLKCGRIERCGWEGHVKELYPDIFDDWSKRHRKTEAAPNAAADAYLAHGRGFDLQGLRGSYSQEWYQDQELGIGSATVRFPLPGGGYWERLIDQPARFGKKKARFSYGTAYRGQWWQPPGVTFDDLAVVDELWLAEGIFDAIALRQSAKVAAVSLMSCNNYPEQALADLRRGAAAIGRPPPRLIFAFDVGKAGTEYTRKFVRQAREAGWVCGAAQVRPDGEGDKLDWNDLAQRERLEPANLEEYRWNGEVTIAGSATEKALLFYQRHKTQSFPLVFAGRQLWAQFSIERIQAVLQQWLDSDDAELADFRNLPFQEQWNRAAAEAAEISELANCTFRTLYFQRDPNLEEGAYFIRIDFPSDRASVKATFSGAACAASSEFKKRLASIAPGAQWIGNQYQIDKLMLRQWATIRMVEAIQFTGYSIDHGAWIFGDIAVHKGRVYEPNDEDYFVLGKQSVKLRTNERLLRCAYDPEKLDLGWVPPLVTAFFAKGIVVLAFWVLSFFAEQIRAEQDSLGFLEATGIPGTGKSTLIEFLWTATGRANYEGFDPTKATNAGIARTLGQVGNLPVVLIEGDRNQDTPHARRFEWDELKTAYNGRAVRTRAIANGGMETFEPPFRGAILIAQNDTVEASPAIRRDLTAVASVLAHAIDEGWIEDNAAQAFSRQRLPERRDPIQLPTPDAIAFTVGRQRTRFGDMMLFARETGMREEEIASLEHGAIDIVGRAATIVGKRRRLRSVPLSKLAIEIVQRQPRFLKCGYVFWHLEEDEEGKPVAQRYRNVSSNFGDYTRRAEARAKRAGIEYRRFRFHDLRHLFAVEYLRDGRGGIYDLQRILGHSSVKTTEIYLDFLTPDQAAAAMVGVAQKAAHRRRRADAT